MTFTGLFVPLITPFDSSGRVATDALQALSHELVDAGAAGLVALGTTAEASVLTPAERASVVEALIAVCRARGVPLVVGANTAAELDDLAGRPGVAAALTVVPPFVRPGEAGVIAHFRALASRSPVPLLVYDVPARTGQYLSASALRELAAIPGVVGTKHAPGGITADTVELLAEQPDGFAVLGGDDVFVSPVLAMGAFGAILASAHCATSEFAQLVAAWSAPTVHEARVLGGRLSRLAAALFAAPNPTVLKGVLHAEGRIPTPDVRLPLLPASADLVEAARTALAQVIPRG